MRSIGIFEADTSSYRIKHSYVYNFFLADHIHQNLSSPSMQDHVRSLCYNAWSRQTANTLVFLSFHSDSPIIVESLLSRLKNSYSNVREFDFSNGSSNVLNKLIKDIPKQIIDNSHTKERRDRRLDIQDLDDSPGNEKEDVRSDVPLGEMEGVFMAVEILGHILRNHYARLDAQPKKVIFDTATSAILRCMENLFNLLANSVETIIHIIESALESFEGKARPENKDKNKDARERISRHVVFLLTTGFVIHCGRKLSRAVGDENLEITYRQALSSNSQIAKEYLDAMIKLDCFQSFPADEVKVLSEKLKKDLVGTAALRFAVAERLDMRPPANHADLQKYCDLVGLELAPRVIERQRMGS